MLQNPLSPKHLLKAASQGKPSQQNLQNNRAARNVSHDLRLLRRHLGTLFVSHDERVPKHGSFVPRQGGLHSMMKRSSPLSSSHLCPAPPVARERRPHCLAGLTPRTNPRSVLEALSQTAAFEARE